VPQVDSFEQLDAMVDEWDAADDARRIGTRPHTIGEHFAAEQPLLPPLPAETFETGIWLTSRVDRFSQITARTNRYSVPVRLIGRQVRVQLHASHLVVYDDRVSPAGPRPSPTRGSAPRSSTGSPSAATSSRPAPTPPPRSNPRPRRAPRHLIRFLAAVGYLVDQAFGEGRRR
jgi:hypothetical protein